VIWDIDPLEDCLANAYLELGTWTRPSGNMSASCDLTPTIRWPTTTWARLTSERVFAQSGANWNTRASWQVWKDADPEIPEVLAAKKVLEIRSNNSTDVSLRLLIMNPQI